MGLISISEQGAAELTPKLERWSRVHFLISIQMCQVKRCELQRRCVNIHLAVATTAKVDDARRVVSNDMFCIQVSALN